MENVKVISDSEEIFENVPFINEWIESSVKKLGSSISSVVTTCVKREE